MTTGTAIVPLSPKIESQLTHYNAARKALATCVRIDDVKHIRDYHAAMAAAAKIAGNSELEDMAKEIRMRAERKAGELLIEMKARGERAERGTHSNRKPEAELSRQGKSERRIRDQMSNKSTQNEDKPKPVTLSQLGIARNQSSTWQKLAKLPEKEFEQKVAGSKAPRKRKATATAKTACEVDWSNPSPKDFADTTAMYAAQADHYAHEAAHLAAAYPLLTARKEHLDPSVVTKSRIQAAQRVVTAWSSVVSKLEKIHGK